MLHIFKNRWRECILKSQPHKLSSKKCHVFVFYFLWSVFSEKNKTYRSVSDNLWQQHTKKLDFSDEYYDYYSYFTDSFQIFWG